MFLLAVSAVVLAVLIGFVVRSVLHHWPVESSFGVNFGITWAEFTAVSVLMALVITPSVMLVGKKLSVANIVRYEQFLNGAETKAIDNVVKCQKGSSGGSASSGHSNCTNEYRTGETYTYEVPVEETYPCTDSDGELTTCTRTVWEPRTGYIYAPYATREHTYVINSSFGFKENDPFNFSGIFLDADPVPYAKKAIPSNIPRGAPADWLDAKAHLDMGDPRPVTVLDGYDNYILASDDEVLKAYSADIARFKKAGLLPAHTANIMTDPITGPSKSQANKLSFVGVTVPDQKVWQDALMRFNAALGMELQGDMHVVLVDSARVTTQDAVPYINALKAYWQGPTFKKRALAKNGIVLAIGVTNNSQVEWAEATTGMPFGNELMAQYLRDYLPGVALNPQMIFGSPRTVITGDKAKVTHPLPMGVVEQIVFESAPFERASMSCEEEGCVGFKDLLDTIEPTKTQKTIMMIITIFLACLLWFLVGASSIVDDSLAGLLGRTGSNRKFYDEDEVIVDLYRDRGFRRFKRKGKNTWTSW